MKAKSEHEQRIQQELKAAGVTRYGMMKFAIKYLPNIIHDNEHIGGVVYGRYSSGASSLNEGTLVATDKRLMFLDHKPGFTSLDEVTYDVVSGVMNTSAGFSGVTLHTRMGDYVVRFANRKCADIFTEFVEKQRLEKNGQNGSAHNGAVRNNNRAIKQQGVSMAKKFNDDETIFLNSHELAVMSTVDRTGNVSGAVVYYYPAEDGIYILTKDSTQKAHNLFGHSQVALTIYDAMSMQTLQLQGTASVETDLQKRQQIFTEIVKPRDYVEGKRLPPVTQIKEGMYLPVKITPTTIKFTDYSSKEN